MKDISITLAPVAKPRMTRRDAWCHRPCVEAYREWADELRQAATGNPRLKLSGVFVKVELYCRFRMPVKSWSQKKLNAHAGKIHTAKPDIDNILKGVMDALMKKDQTVAIVSAIKRWACNHETEKTLITLYTEEDLDRGEIYPV